MDDRAWRMHGGAGGRKWRIVAAGGTTAAALLLAACGSSGSATTTTTTAAATTTTGAAAPTVGVVDLATVGAHGTVLVTKTGATLYRYVPDGTGAPTCSGQCATVWPPLTVAAGTTAPAAGTGVPSADLGTVSRSDGTLQVTYKHMPLYAYSGDSAPGQASGQGIGNVWFVVPVGSGSSGSTTTTAAAHGYGY